MALLRAISQSFNGFWAGLLGGDVRPPKPLPASRELEALRRENAALREAQQRIRELLDLGDGFIEFDSGFRYTDMNVPAVRMHGRSLEELRGRVLWQEYPFLLGTDLELIYRRIVAEKVSAAFEYFSEPTGSWYEIHAFPSEAGGLYAIYRDITPLKHATRRLEHAATERAALLERERAAYAEAEQERARLFSVFEQAPALILLGMGPEHRCVLVNPLARQLLDREILGKPVRQVLPELEEQGYLELLDQVYATGEPYLGREVRLLLNRRGSGAPRELFLTFIFQPWLDMHGRTIGVMAFGFEVTDQVRAQQKAAELVTAQELSRRQLEAIIQSMDEGLIIARPDGQILTMNPAALSTHGFTDVRQAKRHLSELAGAFAVFDLGHEPLPLERWPLSRVLRGERFSGYQVRVRRLETGHEWVGSYGGAPVRDPDGRLLLAVLTVRDITEATRAEQALRESELRYRSLVAATTSIVWTSGPQGDFIAPQASWEEYTGQPWEEHRGFGWLEALHLDSRPIVQELWRKARAERGIYESEGRLWSVRHQQYRYFSARAAPVLNAHGTVREWIGMVTDVHDRKSALEASRLKSEFLANMSHELRTPLNSIIGFSELLHSGKAGPLNERQREFLGDIVSSGRHLLSLINDVLDLSKVEAGKMEFHPEPVELRAVAQGVVDVLREMATKKRMRVELEIAPELQGLVLDPARLKQVFYNYLSNALKFTPEGGQVTVRALPEGEERFRLEVEDTGIGIHPEDMERLFNPFQQLDAGPAKHYSGTGLGLALTQHLVSGQGGQVGVRSTPGVGSIFFAILPRITGPAIVPVVGQGPHVGPRQQVPEILVIEDAMEERNWLVRALVSAGYAVEAASTGQAAVSLGRQRRFDAITLDLLLPDMSGMEAGRLIREQGASRDSPIFVITVVREREAALDFPVQEVLIKPVSAEKLVEALSRAGVRASSME